MASDEILDVHVVSKEDGDYVAKCPHCKKFIGIEGDDLSEIRGEQYQCRCGGWMQISSEAVYRRLV